MAKILITMKDDLLARVDELAAAEGSNRSEYIRTALRMYMRETSNELGRTHYVKPIQR
jgi:metal-responsive CopG/Arc/MetJ family transcriptional regulator